MYANIGETSRNTRRFSAILETGAGSSFIQFNELTMPLQERIKTLDSSVKIRNESGKTVPIVGHIDMIAQIGTSQATVTFLVAKQFATEVIIRWDYCELNVESIRPRRWHVEMDNGFIVPIVRQPRGR